MKIAALVDDLFFSTKISSTAKELGAEVIFCRSAETVPSDATRVCVDLNALSFDAVAEIQKIRAGNKVPVFAFLSHVQIELKRKAEEAGATEVMPRSAFVQRLPDLLS